MRELFIFLNYTIFSLQSQEPTAFYAEISENYLMNKKIYDRIKTESLFLYHFSTLFRLLLCGNTHFNPNKKGKFS